MKTDEVHERLREEFDGVVSSIARKYRRNKMADENMVEDFVPSTHRWTAKRIDDEFAGTDNPEPLPRFFVISEDGRRHEMIRGLDICLKHVKEYPHMGCKEKPRARGLCTSCRQKAADFVSKNFATWEMIEAAHAALPSARDVKRKNEILSMKEFLISTGVYIGR